MESLTRPEGKRHSSVRKNLCQCWNCGGWEGVNFEVLGESPSLTDLDETLGGKVIGLGLSQFFNPSLRPCIANREESDTESYTCLCYPVNMNDDGHIR